MFTEKAIHQSQRIVFRILILEKIIWDFPPMVSIHLRMPLWTNLCWQHQENTARQQFNLPILHGLKVQLTQQIMIHSKTQWPNLTQHSARPTNGFKHRKQTQKLVAMQQIIRIWIHSNGQVTQTLCHIPSIVIGFPPMPPSTGIQFSLTRGSWSTRKLIILIVDTYNELYFFIYALYWGLDDNLF